MLTRRDLLASLPLLAWPGSLSAAVGDPGPRAGHVLVYHARRNAVCLLGGYQGRAPEKERVWFWNGVHWDSQSAPAGGVPFSRTLPAAAFDTEHDTVAYFGGITLATGKPTGELWSLSDDGRWTVSVDGTPGPRDHHAAVYDARRKRVVVYGGQDTQRRWVTETWEVEGHEWKWMKGATGPGERAHHAMAYDTRRGRTVLYGGFGKDNAYRGETWEWDGRLWRRAANDGPRPRARHRMAYDQARGVTVLFGGDTGNPGGRFEVTDETPGASASSCSGGATAPRSSATPGSGTARPGGKSPEICPARAVCR